MRGVCRKNPFGSTWSIPAPGHTFLAYRQRCIARSEHGEPDPSERETPMTRTLVLAVGAGLLAALLLTVAPVAPPTSPLATPTAAAAPAERAEVEARYERRVLRHTNLRRAHHGRRALRIASCLDRRAEVWGRRLATTGTFRHQSMQVLSRRCGHPRRGVGENLYASTPHRALPFRAVRAWMRSPGHRRNLLNRRYTHVGIAAKWSPRRKQWIVVQTLGGF
jgi:uncharacterized protein YkwD